MCFLGFVLRCLGAIIVGGHAMFVHPLVMKYSKCLQKFATDRKLVRKATIPAGRDGAQRDSKFTSIVYR